MEGDIYIQWNGLLVAPTSFGIRRVYDSNESLTTVFENLVETPMHAHGNSEIHSKVNWSTQIFLQMNASISFNESSTSLQFFLRCSGEPHDNDGDLVMSGSFVKLQGETFDMQNSIVSGLVASCRVFGVSGLQTSFMGIMYLSPMDNGSTDGEWKYFLHGKSLDNLVNITSFDIYQDPFLEDFLINESSAVYFSSILDHGLISIGYVSFPQIPMHASNITFAVNTSTGDMVSSAMTYLQQTFSAKLPKTQNATDPPVLASLSISNAGTLCFSILSLLPCHLTSTSIIIEPQSEPPTFIHVPIVSSKEIEGCVSTVLALPVVVALHYGDVTLSMKSVTSDGLDTLNITNFSVKSEYKFELQNRRRIVILSPTGYNFSEAQPAFGIMFWQSRSPPSNSTFTPWFFSMTWNASSDLDAKLSEDLSVYLNDDPLTKMVPRSISPKADFESLYGFAMLNTSHSVFDPGSNDQVYVKNESEVILQGGFYTPRFGSARYIHSGSSILSTVLVKDVNHVAYEGCLVSVIEAVPLVSNSVKSEKGVHVSVELLGFLNLSVTSMNVTFIKYHSNQSIQKLCTFTMASSTCDHLCTGASWHSFIGSHVLLNYDNSVSLAMSGLLSVTHSDYVGVLSAPLDSYVNENTSTIPVGSASAHVASTGEIFLDVQIAGLTNAPQGNSEVAFGNIGNLTSVNSKPLQFSTVMPRPILPYTKSNFQVSNSSFISATGGLGLNANVNEMISTYHGDLGLQVLAMVIIRTSNGVACTGQLKRVGPAFGIFTTFMSQSSTIGILNDLIYTVGSPNNTFVVGSVSSLVDMDNGLLSYFTRLHTSPPNLCFPANVNLFHGSSQISTESLQGQEEITGLWNLPTEEGKLFDVMRALSNGTVRIKVYTSNGSLVPFQEVAVGAINSGHLYYPLPVNVLMPETAEPGYFLFKNNPVRPFSFSVNSSKLKYSVPEELFQVLYY